MAREHAERRWWLGRVRSRKQSAIPESHSVCGPQCDAGSFDGGCDCARGGMPGADGLVGESSNYSAGASFYPPRSNSRRAVVWALGRELHLRQQQRIACIGDRRIVEGRGLPGCGELAALGAKFGWRIRRVYSFLLRPVAEREREEHGFADGLGHHWIARGVRSA